MKRLLALIDVNIPDVPEREESPSVERIEVLQKKLDTSLFLCGILIFIGLVILIGLVAFGIGWLAQYVLRRSD